MSAPDAADAAASASASDPLPEAMALAEGAAKAGIGLKLLGGLAVRVLCPDYPPRLRRDQDIDFACLSKERKKVATYLADSGCQADRMFNNLNGDRQMYFVASSGRADRRHGRPADDVPHPRPAALVRPPAAHR